MKMVTRDEAIEAGLKRFFTGRPCKHGHLAERYVLSGGCVDCHKEAGEVHQAAIRDRIMAARRKLGVAA